MTNIKLEAMRKRVENAIVESSVEDHTDLNDLTNKLLDLYLVMLSESEEVIQKESEDLSMQEDEEYARGFRCGYSRMIGIIEEKLHSA